MHAQWLLNHRQKKLMIYLFSTFLSLHNLPSPFTPVLNPRPSLWLPPRGRGRQDVQPDHRPVPLQGRRHRHHLQPLRQGLPAEPFAGGPLHQWVAHLNMHITSVLSSLVPLWNIWKNIAGINSLTTQHVLKGSILWSLRSLVFVPDFIGAASQAYFPKNLL